MKYYPVIEFCKYYLERFKDKDKFSYHLKNFINEDVKKWNTKPPKNIDAICNYGWKVYSSLTDEEKKSFIYSIFVFYHQLIEAFRNMKLVEVKKILTKVKINEEIFKNNYLIYDAENHIFRIYDSYGNEVGMIFDKNEVNELCKYFKIPISTLPGDNNEKS